jgi:hypothetical protein
MTWNLTKTFEFNPLPPPNHSNEESMRTRNGGTLCFQRPHRIQMVNRKLNFKIRIRTLTKKLKNNHPPFLNMENSTYRKSSSIMKMLLNRKMSMSTRGRTQA